MLSFYSSYNYSILSTVDRFTGGRTDPKWSCATRHRHFSSHSLSTSLKTMKLWTWTTYCKTWGDQTRQCESWLDWRRV